MQFYIAKAPASRLRYRKNAVFKLGLAVLVMLVLLAFTQAAYAAHTLNLKFDQTAYKGDVWLQIQDPFYHTVTTTHMNFQGTYTNDTGTHAIDFKRTPVSPADDTVIMSVPVKLSDLGAGGLSITFAQSAVFFVFYNDPSGNDREKVPEFMNSAITSYSQRFMPFEVTMVGTDGDYGNLTAINYFTAPLTIHSYHASTPPALLQHADWGGATGNQIGGALYRASGGSAKVVEKDAKGKILRVIGPSNDFSSRGGNPWPSFIPYTKSIHAATPTQITKIHSNPQGFFFNKDNSVVYHFGVDMSATADAVGNLTVTGGITASVTGTIKKGNPALPTGGKWDDATLYFSTAVPEFFNNAIYRQVDTPAFQHWGMGLIQFVDFCQRTLLDPNKPYNNSVPPTDPNYNPSLLDAGATQAPVWQTWYDNSIGEITAGLLCGFFNSNVMVGDVAIKDMPSNQWWTLGLLYSKAQPDHPYYNPYANVIYMASNNTAYGMPYSDRFKGVAINTVKYDGKSVDSWVVGIGAPFTALPAMTGMMELLLLQ
jgi:hypothetical protein